MTEKGKRNLALIVYAILTAVILTHSFYYFFQLPDQVAIHFGPSGRPDAMASSSYLLMFEIIIISITAAIFLGSHLMIGVLPVDMINLPNKDYWLAPERRAETVMAIQTYLAWFGSITVLFMLDVFHQTALVNLGKAEKLTHFWLSLGVYLILSTVWSIALVRRFCKKVH